ncbi:DUF6665 family protein [Steroidobacter cummioxidans]|uniref:DUF6665 family protein n=1 Tax=Steroidobacter cummioxidans TaxID=1803913 RepID=UPI000E3121C8|nr:DUF6665 family protein [Steroidobacter cummioxidans]
MPKFDNPLDLPFAGEAAASLGLAGRKLKKTLDALRQYDADVSSSAHPSDEAARKQLVMGAAEAYWGYVVQREQLGLLDPEYIAKEYDIPSDVKLAMGPKGRGPTA